ncbi:CPBP family intramembrane glutamic endopeptidase [Silvibacterium sp.]|uniref:CPBP family intramembrane glutamic endopeptidase n=1 Tax=Silvibacterium sp. TaxID=1964179 RepID=UPI0039E2D4AA
MSFAVPLSSSGNASSPETAHRNGGRLRDALELTIGYALIVSVLWTEGPAQRVCYWSALVVVLGISIARRRPLREMGFTLGGFLRSLWVPAVALLLALIEAAVAAHLHTLHRNAVPMLLHFRFAGYALWALVQQFLLQDYFFARLRRLVPATPTGTRAAAVVSAALFALAHLPSPILTALTLVWGWLSCLLFLRYRNLYTLGIAHAILGITIALTVPGRIDHHMRVGLAYLHYHPHWPPYGRMHGPHASGQQPIQLPPLPSAH